MSNENKSNLHPIFEQIADAINPNKKPFNALQETDLKEPVQDKSLREIAIASHNKNRLCGYYPFLQLNDDNESTYTLGFVAGCMHVTQENIKKLAEENSPTLNRYANTEIDNGIVD